MKCAEWCKWSPFNRTHKWHWCLVVEEAESSGEVWRGMPVQPVLGQMGGPWEVLPFGAPSNWHLSTLQFPRCMGPSVVHGVPEFYISSSFLFFTPHLTVNKWPFSLIWSPTRLTSQWTDEVVTLQIHSSGKGPQLESFSIQQKLTLGLWRQ